ncbi:MAG: hypothetical protein WBC04_13445 [Candidatus Acidiferrales bacterium]
MKGVTVNLTATLPQYKKQIGVAGGPLSPFHFVALLLLFFPALAYSRAVSQEQERRPLGSLSTVGEVYVNDSRAPAESTIFSGDVLTTGQGGTATFAMSGKGTFKISPQSVLVFAGEPQYVAELKSGTVVMSSFAGATDIILRAGNFTVGPVVQEEHSTAKIDREVDGSFLVSCLEGSVGVLPLQGAAGRFLQAGQALSISPEGELIAPKQPSVPAAAPAPSPAPTPTTTPTTSGNKKSYKGWIILGLAGAGAAGAAAAAAGGGGGHPVSPSSP